MYINLQEMAMPNVVLISIKVNKFIWGIDFVPDIEWSTTSSLDPVSSITGINNPSP